MIYFPIPTNCHMCNRLDHLFFLLPLSGGATSVIYLGDTKALTHPWLVEAWLDV